MDGLQNYSSSSGSDSSEDEGKDERDAPPAKRIKSVPGAMLAPSKPDAPAPLTMAKGSAGDGRIRSQPHTEGLYATHVYVQRT